MVAIPEQRISSLLTNSTSYESTTTETVPIVNRKETVLAVSIVFQVS